MNNTIAKAFANAMTYDEYMDKFENLVKTDATTGADQSELLVNFTKLNYRRMTRLNKTVKPSEKLIADISEIPFKMEWIIISEAWCGDAAQNIPYVAQLAKACDNVELSIVLRDENLEFMDQYLTNGGRSIPKVIFLKAAGLEEMSTWGPRPEIIQEQVVEFQKNAPEDLSYEKFAETIHAWYAKNKNEALETELLTIFQSLKETILD